jgi:hypothetical protein
MQQTAVLLQHLKRIVLLAQEVLILLVKHLLLQSLRLCCGTLLLVKPCEVRLLLHLPEVTERLRYLARLSETLKTEVGTELPRLLRSLLRLHIGLLVSKSRLRTVLSTKSLHAKSSLKVLLCRLLLRCLFCVELSLGVLKCLLLASCLNVS